MAQQKPDQATARSLDRPFPIHPEGQFAARCVDIINLGLSVIEYPGSETYTAEKVALVFYTGEFGVILDENGEWNHSNIVDPTLPARVVHLVQEFTLSMGKKAKLRAFLEAWRNKAYTEEEAKKGVDVNRLYGHPALIGATSKLNKAGDRHYTIIQSVAPLPKLMASAIPALEDIQYERDEYWETKKKAIVEETKKFLASRGPRTQQGAPRKTAEPTFEDFPDAQDGDDDLPF